MGRTPVVWNGGGTIQCPRSRGPRTFRYIGVGGHPSRSVAAVKRAVFRSRAACVEHARGTLCPFSGESEPPRWGKRPPGPFPSVGASTGS